MGDDRESLLFKQMVHRWTRELTPKSGGTLKSGRKPIRSIQTGTDILRNVRSSRNSESTAMKPGLNRREHRLRSRGALQRLEPDEGKLSRPVLRGGSSGNAALLPDRRCPAFA